jgi:hypothetical protein
VLISALIVDPVPLHKRQRIIHVVLLQELDPDDASEERRDCRLRRPPMSVYSRLLSQSEVCLPSQLWKYFDQKSCPFLLMGGMRTCPAKDLRRTTSLSKPERAQKFQVTNHESSSCHRAQLTAWKGIQMILSETAWNNPDHTVGRLQYNPIQLQETDQSDLAK